MEEIKQCFNAVKMSAFGLSPEIELNIGFLSNFHKLLSIM